MQGKEEVYAAALKGKKYPILTLDHKWHQMFQHMEPTPELKQLEKQLNELVKRQGKLTTESKEIKKLKKKLMDEIVSLMDSIGQKEPDKKTRKKLDDNSRLINECNEKIEAYEDELFQLPRKIEELNCRLMLSTMEICYCRLRENATELEEIDQWITQMRRELKKKLVRKREKEVLTQQIYSYMHDIFGAEVIEIFDMQQFPDHLLERKQIADEEKQDSADHAGK